MLKYQEPFVYGFDSYYQMIGRERVKIVRAKIGFFMMQKPDNNMVVYQDTLGNYNEISPRHVMEIDDDILEVLECEIIKRYDHLTQIINRLNQNSLMAIDPLIEKKGKLLREIQDIKRKETDITPLSSNQAEQIRRLEKAVKRISKHMRKFEYTIDKAGHELEILDVGQTTSIELMRQNIKNIKG